MTHVVAETVNVMKQTHASHPKPDEAQASSMLLSNLINTVTDGKGSTRCTGEYQDSCNSSLMCKISQSMANDRPIPVLT